MEAIRRRSKNSDTTSRPEDDLDGGESLNQFYERVRATFGDIRKQHAPERFSSSVMPLQTK